jgi:hypothetical protein
VHLKGGDGEKEYGRSNAHGMHMEENGVGEEKVKNRKMNWRRNWGL